MIKMYSRLSRSLLFRNPLILSRRLYNTTNDNEQINIIKSILGSNTLDNDWPALKNSVISTTGKINSKNIDGVLLKIMISDKKYDVGLAFAEYLKKENEEMPIGCINGLLNLYSAISQTRKLTKAEKKYIIDSYEYLYEKYKVLDYKTSECLIVALCAINDWKKALKVLEDLELSTVPTHLCYSITISALFRSKKKKDAFELIKKSLSNKRHLQFCAYEAWVEYILKTEKDNKSTLKSLNNIFVHISKYCSVVDKQTAILLKETFSKLNWNADFTKIRKTNGQCAKCNESLKLLSLTNEEFQILQQNVKDKLIVGSDLFLKTSPKELESFQEFISETAPYDIVIDALNVAYAVGKRQYDRLPMIVSVVDYFKQRDKKVLLLGRKHMLKWDRGGIRKLMKDTCCFFTENISQDDPYFISAAILSGPHTDIVSKDLLRTHSFQLKDENLRFLFKKWQWQHQWMIFASFKHKFNLQPPLKFTPCAQEGSGWHIPYEAQEDQPTDITNDGTPDLSSWLCIKPKLIKLDDLL